MPLLKITKKIKTKRKPKSKPAQIIGQGTYGCVFRPDINCHTQLPGSNDYLSKISLQNTFSMTEISIGKVIKSIPNFHFFFAPILESCDINVSTIDHSQIEKCDVITKSYANSYANSLTGSTIPKFVSNKIRYVGNQDLNAYLYHILIAECNNSSLVKCLSHLKKTKNIINLLSKVVETHLYLLNSIKLLNENGIVHLDLKFNNIIHDKDNDVFIIIDFGLSKQIKDMEATNYQKYSKRRFGVLVETYPPWAIDIVMLSYIAKQIKTNNSIADLNASVVDLEKFKSKITETQLHEMKRHCTLYATKNEVFQMSIFTETDRKTMETKLHKWIDGFKGKTMREIWTTILSFNKSWDNYSLAVMFLQIFQDTGILDFILRSPSQLPDKNNVWTTISNVVTGATSEQRKGFHFLIEYATLMKNIILAEPMSRPAPLDTSTQIKTIFKRIDRAVFAKLVKLLNVKILQPKNIETIKANQLRRNLKDITAERDLQHKINAN